MDEATRQRLLAQWNAADKPVTTPSVGEDTNARLIKQWNDREKARNRNGAENFVNAFSGAIGDTGIGIAQALGQADPASVKRMQDRRAADTMTNAGRFGNIVGSTVVPTLATAGITGGLGALPLLRNAYATRNAIGSGVGGAIIPTMEGESNLKNAMVSAAIGGGPAIAKRLFGQPLKPTADAQMLIDRGIYPTPGQAVGGRLDKLESATTSHPLYGTTISEARSAAFPKYVQERQKAFGYTGDKLGREATEEMAHQAEMNYNKVIPKLMLEDTPALRAKYLRAQNELEPGSRQFNDVNRMITQKFDPLFENSQARIIGGDDLNKWQSQLRVRSETAGRGDDLFQNDLSNAYKTMRNDTLDAVESQGLVAPEAAKEFSDARKYYAGMKDLMSLSRSGSSRVREGQFTPSEDLRWMEAKNPEAFARNEMPDQRFAQAARNTLGEVPDSGTAGRLAMLDFLKDPKQLINPQTYLGLPLTLGAWEPMRKFAVGAYGPQRALSNALRESEGLAFPSVAPYLTETYNENQR